jgi:hypothetical protein
MDALLEKQKDILMLDIMPKEEDQERKEISVKSKSSYTKSKKIHSCKNLLRGNAHQVLLTQSEEFC